MTWTVRERSVRRESWEIRDAEQRIAAIVYGYDNQRMVRNAPRLLEACQEAERMLNESLSGMTEYGVADWLALLHRVRRAIAAAGGTLP